MYLTISLNSFLKFGLNNPFYAKSGQKPNPREEYTPVASFVSSGEALDEWLLLTIPPFHVSRVIVKQTGAAKHL